MGLLVAGAVVVVAVVAAAVVVARPAPDGLAKSKALVADDARFVTAQGSGLTFVKVATLLRAEAESCAKRRAQGSPRCAALFSASAYAQVSAVLVLDCTRPGVFDARQSMRRYLDALSRDPPPPDVPTPVKCG